MSVFDVNLSLGQTESDRVGSNGDACVNGRRAPVVELFTSLEPFDSLAGELTQLQRENASGNIFLTSEWMSSWWEVFGAGLQPWILVARDVSSKRIVGFAPFALRRHPIRGGPFRELSFVGNIAGAADHLDVLASAGHEDAVAMEFAEFLHRHRRHWDVLRLDGVVLESRLAALLRQQSTRTTMTWESVCPYLRLPTRREDFLAMLRHKERVNLLRCARRLQEDTHGRVEYEQVLSEDELPAALEDLFRLHQGQWAERGEPGAFRDPAVRDFHQRLCARLLPNDRLRLYLLKANGRAIAAAYCFRFADTVSIYQTGFDRAWGRYSPGNAIFAHAICRAIEEGAREFDFLRGAEQFKFRWTDTARRELRLRLATTRRGSMLVLTYRMAKAVRDRLRRWRGDGHPLLRG
jgi:CelD/BcsL family acetyltransferase involved in cellulose biosynthesis